MPATRKKCKFCTKKFWACRVDALYCNQKCCFKARDENRKFQMAKSEIPRSGIPGVTFSRFRMRWEARIGHKYLGSFKRMEDAIQFRNEVVG